MNVLILNLECQNNEHYLHGQGSRVSSAGFQTLSVWPYQQQRKAVLLLGFHMTEKVLPVPARVTRVILSWCMR